MKDGRVGSGGKVEVVSGVEEERSGRVWSEEVEEVDGATEE